MHAGSEEKLRSYSREVAQKSRVSCDHAQLSQSGVKNIQFLVKRAAIVWRNKRLLTSPLHFRRDYERWHSHFFPPSVSSHLPLSFSPSLRPSLSKQASRQSVQSSLLIASSHGWVESQLFPSALSMLHFSSYPLIPFLTYCSDLFSHLISEEGFQRRFSFRESSSRMKSVKTGISSGLNIIDCMTEMPEMLIIKLPNCMPDYQFKTHFSDPHGLCLQPDRKGGVLSWLRGITRPQDSYFSNHTFTHDSSPLVQNTWRVIWAAISLQSNGVCVGAPSEVYSKKNKLQPVSKSCRKCIVHSVFSFCEAVPQYENKQDTESYSILTCTL